MHRSLGSRLLPHEYFFGGFLLIHWLRLINSVGLFDPDATLYAGLLLAQSLTLAWCLRRETPKRWHLRLWFYPAAMIVVFFTMQSAILKVTPDKCDDLLASFDQHLFGCTLSARLQSITTPVLTEILSFCYLLFFPYFILSWIYYAYRGLPLLKKMMIGCFTIYGLGFLGYSIFPAGGPYLAFPDEFNIPLTGWAITNLNSFVVKEGSNGVDVFPSLHCAISLYLLLFDRRHAPRLYRVLLIPCIGLWIATIYLRYHYLIDVACGFALAGFALWIANRWEQRDSRAA